MKVIRLPLIIAASVVAAISFTIYFKQLNRFAFDSIGFCFSDCLRLRVEGCVQQSSVHCLAILLARELSLRPIAEPAANAFAGAALLNGVGDVAVEELLRQNRSERTKSLLLAFSAQYLLDGRTRETEDIAKRFGAELGYRDDVAAALFDRALEGTAEQIQQTLDRFRTQLGTERAEILETALLAARGEHDQAMQRTVGWQHLIEARLPSFVWPVFRAEDPRAVYPVASYLRENAQLVPSAEACGAGSSGVFVGPTPKGRLVLLLTRQVPIAATVGHETPAAPEWDFATHIQQGRDGHAGEVAVWRKMMARSLVQDLREGLLPTGKTAIEDRDNTRAIAALITLVAVALDQRDLEDAFQTGSALYDLLLTLVKYSASTERGVRDQRVYRSLIVVLTYELARGGLFGLAANYFEIVPASELLLKFRMAICSLHGLLERNELNSAISVAAMFVPAATEFISGNEPTVDRDKRCEVSILYAETCLYVGNLKLGELLQPSADRQAVIHVYLNIEPDRQVLETQIALAVGATIAGKGIDGPSRAALVVALESFLGERAAAIIRWAIVPSMNGGDVAAPSDVYADDQGDLAVRRTRASRFAVDDHAAVLRAIVSDESLSQDRRLIEKTIGGLLETNQQSLAVELIAPLGDEKRRVPPVSRDALAGALVRGGLITHLRGLLSGLDDDEVLDVSLAIMFAIPKP